MTCVPAFIRRWLGWCQKVRTLVRPLAVMNNEVGTSAPSQGTVIPERAESLSRYRNHVLLWAVFFTLVFAPFVVHFLADDLTRLLLFTGTITGLGVFAIFGRWILNSLEMLEKGMTIKTGPGEYIILFLIAGVIPLGVILIIATLTALLSLAGPFAFPAFATGFAFIPWYVFILILWWERRTGCILMFDKKTHSFSAARGSGKQIPLNFL